MDRKRKAISLGNKIEILDSLAKGEGSTSVSKRFRLNESTIRTIKRMENSIRESVICGSKLTSATSSYCRDIVLEKMENVLVLWMDDLSQKRVPIDGNIIKQKALRIHTKIQEKDSSSSLQATKSKKKGFSASDGWLSGFLKRNGYHNVKIKGEIASANENAAKSFKPELLKIIVDGGYDPDQVFNADETGLYWKKMPSRTYIAKSEQTASGFKVSKDRVTILLCSNASGDRILKPLVINRAIRPRAMKGKDIKKLPVHWMANKKAWMTACVFREWFNECFVPEVKKYMEEKGLDFHVLLLVDNASSHPVIDHPNIQVIFLPPNTTPLIQPLDRGIIAAFKLYYIKLAFKYVLDAIENGNLSIIDAWQKYTIMDSIINVSLAIQQLRTSTLNACWKAIWPECVICESSIPDTTPESSEIIALAHQIAGEGFEDMNTDDINELMIDTHLDEDDLIQLITYDRKNDNHNSDMENDGENSELTSKLIDEGLKLGESMIKHFLDNDPDVERALKFQRDLKICLAGYQELFKKVVKPKQQKKITDFLVERSSMESK